MLLNALVICFDELKKREYSFFVGRDVPYVNHDLTRVFLEIPGTILQISK